MKRNVIDSWINKTQSCCLNEVLWTGATSSSSSSLMFTHLSLPFLPLAPFRSRNVCFCLRLHHWNTDRWTVPNSNLTGLLFHLLLRLYFCEKVWKPSGPTVSWTRPCWLIIQLCDSLTSFTDDSSFLTLNKLGCSFVFWFVFGLLFFCTMFEVIH